MTDTVDVQERTEEQTDDEIWADLMKDADPDDAQDADADPADADQIDDSEDQDEDADPADAPKAETDDADAKNDPDAQMQRLEHMISTDEGRVRAGRTDSEKLRRRIADHKAKLEALKGEDSDEDQMKTLREDYPDIVEPLAKSHDAMNRRISALTEIEEGEISSAENELQEVQEREWGILIKEHPDFVDFIRPRYKQFDEWVDDQPRRIRNLKEINADGFNDGASAAYLVSLFKRHLSDADGVSQTTTPQPSRRQRQLDGARTTQSRPAVVTSAEPDPNSDDLDAIWDSLYRKGKKDGKF